MSEWMDIETAPKDGTEVLILVDGHRGPAWSNNYSLVAYWSEFGRKWLEERHPEAEPIIGAIKWAPLPEAPK